jgi:hypothetical protein
MWRVWRACAVAWIGCALGGCNSGETPLALPSLDPQAAASQAMKDFDSDGDGALAGAELDKSPGLKAALATLDKNGDKRLTAEEISTHLAGYQAAGAALVSLQCLVTLDGRPLPEAVVTLVPEHFLGDAFRPAKGTTDEHGACMFQTEGEEFPGVACGIFRIEVSRPDASGKETLPPRYNVNTVLGDEVSPVSLSMQNGLRLELKSK